jgi:MFS family permease
MWRDRDFRLLWAGQTASQLGEQTSLVILPLLAVLTLHVGPGELGVLRAVGQAPLLLFALLAGVWVDKRRTRTVMVLADLGRAVALAVAAAIALLGGLGLPVLLVVAFIAGVLSVFFDVAYQASLIRLLRREQLLQGNSAVEGTRSAAQIGGPALGGVMASLLSAPIAAASTALLFAVSFLSIARIRHREAIPARPGGTQRFWRQIQEGLRFVAAHESLRTVAFASAAFQFFLAATMTTYLLFLPRALHLSGTAIGLTLAAAGPGALAGSLLAARLPSRLGYGPVLIAAAAVGDSVMLCVPALRGSSSVTVPALIAINFVFGSFGQLVNVMVMAIRQTVTPDVLQGRVAATITFAGMGMTPFGSLLGGVLAETWGMRTALLLTAAGMLLSPILMALSPLARLGRTVATPESSEASTHETRSRPGRPARQRRPR